MRRTLIPITAIALFACVDSGPPTATEPESTPVPAAAPGGKGKQDTNARANLVWADLVNVAAPSQPADWRPAGIQGDGRLKDGSAATGSPSNEYQGKHCGVYASIEAGIDLDFDTDAGYASLMLTACGSARLLSVFLGGSEGPPLMTGPHSIASGLAMLAPGGSRIQSQAFGVQLPGCQRLAFDDQYAGSSSPLQTRLADATTQNGPVRQWRIESRGTHRAMCIVAGNGGRFFPTGVTYFLPFSLTVTEVPYPYPVFP
jgi:hypothetical protein